MRWRVWAWGIALVLLALPGPLQAEGRDAGGAGPAGHDFTFRRVKVAEAGGPRITVQIDPADQARRLALLSPRALDPGPIRHGGDGAAGGLMRRLAARWGDEIRAATGGSAVSPALVLAVIAVESAGDATAKSPAGAVGLMQLIPATAARFAVADPRDGAANIRGGVAYLDWLMQRFARDPVLVLAAYNAGEGAVSRHAGVPPYAETRAYLPKVMAAWRAARLLCVIPPDRITDPCDLRPRPR